jgi:hypothetical protein
MRSRMLSPYRYPHVGSVPRLRQDKRRGGTMTYRPRQPLLLRLEFAFEIEHAGRQIVVDLRSTP